MINDTITHAIVVDMLPEHVQELCDVSTVFYNASVVFLYTACVYRNPGLPPFVAGTFATMARALESLATGFNEFIENIGTTLNDVDMRIFTVQQMMEGLLNMEICFTSTTFEPLALEAFQAAIDLMELLMMGTSCREYGEGNPEDVVFEVCTAADVVAAKFRCMADAYHWGDDGAEIEDESEFALDTYWARFLIMVIEISMCSHLRAQMKMKMETSDMAELQAGWKWPKHLVK
ncbi:hypothetical protein EWM64_g4742 [Hericium alpestre]|uniref:Uncharacterized protein n=1 Tax=Hericium alpestre TaxID=135208 RepID=A0A4Y9ZYJ5_9AGAM|nr:hypothetical protein EWM64_g4742 [Hericium alpestre]